jgi:hypothetical protein
MRCAKVPAIGNILPGSLLRKLVRKAIRDSESRETWRLGKIGSFRAGA